MNKSFTAYMTNEEKMEKLKEDNFNVNLTKVISVFIILSFSWFSYAVYKIITV